MFDVSLEFLSLVDILALGTIVVVAAVLVELMRLAKCSGQPECSSCNLMLDVVVWTSSCICCRLLLLVL